MEFVIIVPTEETSWGIADRYNIIDYETKEILIYSVKKEDLENTLEKHCYVVKAGEEYLPSQYLSELRKSKEEEKEAERLILIANANEILKHPFSRVCFQVVFGIALLYIWLYGIGAIVSNIFSQIGNIVIVAIVSILTLTYVFSLSIVFRAKRTIKMFSQK